MNNKDSNKREISISAVFFKNLPLFFTSIGHYFVIGGFLSIYIWFVLFNVLAFHLIILNLVIGFIVILLDIFLLLTMKKEYYDTYDYGKNIIIFLSFYLLQAAYFFVTFYVADTELLIIRIFGFSQLKASDIVTLVLKIVGIISLLLSIYSTVLFSRVGHHKVVPAWNIRINIAETIYWTYIGTSIAYFGQLQLSSPSPSKSTIFVSTFFIALLIICFSFIPIYIVKIRIYGTESPETKVLLELIEKWKILFIISFIFIIFSSICLILDSFYHNLYNCEHHGYFHHQKYHI